MNNIVLIGMPGAGKSTIGVLLAKALNYAFMDADLVIQQKQGKKLYEIINENGIYEFLAIEDEVISGIEVSDTIIATGGSAVYGAKAMAHMKATGTIVYIQLSCDEIVRRVNNIKTRGIAMKDGKTLVDVYNERSPLYEQYADVIVDCNDTTVEESVERIVDALIRNKII
ncbi:MAG: shikimate kinase [Wujia sp.]